MRAPLLLTLFACAQVETQEPTDVSDATDEDSDADAYVARQSAWDDVPSAARCRDEDDGTNCLEAHPRALRVDDEVSQGWAAVELNEAEQRLEITLEAGASLDPRIEVGTVLYRGRKDRKPLLHRVTAVQIDGDRVGLSLTRAHVKEAFSRGRVRTRIPIGSPATPPPPARDGLPLAPAPIQRTLGVSDCSGTVFDTFVASPQAQGELKLDLTTCRFELNAWVDAVLVWDSAVDVDHLEVSVGGGIDAALTAELTAALNGGIRQSKAIWSWPEIPITIGGLVITINPELHAGYAFDAAAELTVTQGFEYSTEITEGFGWSDRAGWYTIDERNSTFTPIGPDVYFDGNLTARAFLEPRLDIKAFGIVGGFVSVEAFGEATLSSTADRVSGEYEGELCVDLEVGLAPKIGAICEIPVVNITLFEEEMRLAEFTKKLVDDVCVDWGGPPIADCNPSSPCCTDAECPKDPNDPDLTVTCERGGAYDDGSYRYSCETQRPDDWCLEGNELLGDALCDDGATFTIDECIDDRCVHRSPYDDELGAAPAATVCPAFANCCYVNTDCADGDIDTIDRCDKDEAGAGPEVRGTCSHEARTMPKTRF